MRIKEAREIIDTKLAEMRVANRNIENLQLQLQIEKGKLHEIELLQELFQISIKLMYTNLSSKLGAVITEGLAIVFPEAQYTFMVEFVERRGTIEADLFLQDRNNNKYHPLDAVGGGVSDFISILLRIVYIVLSRYKNVLLADEPLKFISRGKIGKATKFIRQVCEDFNFQLVVVSHIPELINECDARYEVQQRRGVSTIYKM